MCTRTQGQGTAMHCTTSNKRLLSSQKFTSHGDANYRLQLNTGPKGNLVYHTQPNSHMFGNFRSGFNHKGYIPRKVGQGFLKQS